MSYASKRDEYMEHTRTCPRCIRQIVRHPRDCGFCMAEGRTWVNWGTYWAVAGCEEAKKLLSELTSMM